MTKKLAQAAALTLTAEKVDGDWRLYVERGEYSASLDCAWNEGELSHNRTGECRDLCRADLAAVDRWMGDYDAFCDMAEKA